MTTVKILADSLSPQGKRLATFLVRFPRFIEPELLRHRMLSFSAASSRAINLEKHISKVDGLYFTPSPFTKDCKGMSAKENIGGFENEFATEIWKKAKTNAIQSTLALKSLGVHKQHASRLLQNFEYTEYIITGTEFKNFWNLRCPQYIDKNGSRWYSSTYAPVDCENISQAQPEIQELAEKMYTAFAQSTPTRLSAGMWHIPFSNDIPHSFSLLERLKIVSARMARISYLNHDGNTDFEADIKLANRLLNSEHWSVFEHCAQVMNEEEYFDLFTSSYVDREGKLRKTNGVCANLRGYKSLRFQLEHEYEIN